MEIGLGQKNKIMKILVTGGYGYLGANIVKFLSDKYEVIIGSSNKNFKKINSISYEWDNLASLVKATREVDVIIHASGIGSSAAKNNPALTNKLEVNGTNNLIESSIKNKVKKIIYLSSAHVYKSPMNGHITENVVPNNTHPYAKAKLDAEAIFKKKCISNGIELVILRLSNILGAPLFINSNCWSLLPHDLSLQAIKTKILKINNNPNIERDFLSLDSFLLVIKEILDTKFKDDFIYNLGSGKSIKIYDIAKIIMNRAEILFGNKYSLVLVSDERKIDEKLIYDVNKISQYEKIKTILTKDSLIKDIDKLLLFCHHEME